MLKIPADKSSKTEMPPPVQGRDNGQKFAA
jgi:hypothetical protein